MIFCKVSLMILMSLMHGEHCSHVCLHLSSCIFATTSLMIFIDAILSSMYNWMTSFFLWECPLMGDSKTISFSRLKRDEKTLREGSSGMTDSTLILLKIFSFCNISSFTRDNRRWIQNQYFVTVELTMERASHSSPYAWITTFLWCVKWNKKKRTHSKACLKNSCFSAKKTTRGI